MFSQFSRGTDKPVERGPADPQLSTKVRDVSVAVSHGRLSEANLVLGQLELSAALAPPRPGRREAATVRSRMRSPSNSANAAKIPKISFSLDVVVSMLAPWPVRTLNPTPRSERDRTVVTRCLGDGRVNSSNPEGRISPIASTRVQPYGFRCLHQKSSF